MSLVGDMLHTEFPSMGSDVELLLAGIQPDEQQRAVDAARRLAADWERTFSRFNPDSELSRLNATPGTRVELSQRLYDAVHHARKAARMTGGLFNPLILPELLKLGYDRTFDNLPRYQQAGVAAIPVQPIDSLQLDPLTRSITLPAEAGLDLGGIAKGLYVDTLVAIFVDYPAGMISAGGDLRIWGELPGREHWIVGVEFPEDPSRDIVEIEMGAGAVATSGSNRRAWRRGAEPVHHIVDPRTGYAAATPMQSITVVADTATTADVVATALYVGGTSCGQLASLRPAFAIALAIAHDGSIQTIEGGLQLDVHIHEPGAHADG